MLRVIHHKGIFVLFTVAALTAIIFVNVTQANFQSEGVHYWEARYEGPAKNEDEAKAIAVDGSGNVYISW